MLTVASLTTELGLELAAGEGEPAGRPIRWVHISDLPDPTQWLSGGELLLTTGLKLGGAAEQRRLIKLLAERELAGLGFGVGFGHDDLPKALVDEARKRGFPLFEVPFEMPFIAITEAAFSRLVNEQYDVLSRGIAVNQRLERIVLEGGGMEQVAREIAAAISGSAVVCDSRGKVLAEGGRRLAAQVRDSVSAEVAARGTGAAPFVPALPEGAGRGLANPVSPRGGRAEAWLVAVNRSGELGDFERLCVQQGAVVVALELMRERVERETERRLAGEVLEAALSGTHDADDLQARLVPFGIGERAAVIALAIDDPEAGISTLESHLAAERVHGLAGTHPAGRAELLCALVDPGEADPAQIALSARAAVAGAHGPARASVSRTRPATEAKLSFHEARCALEATALANGSAPEVASHEDLGAFTLLLSVQDDEALRHYCAGVLGPIEEAEGGYGDELLRSVEAYIERNGHWERAAADCYCHRHTLRYRIKKVEELTGRDLRSAHDRVELWLALRARELVA